MWLLLHGNQNSCSAHYERAQADWIWYHLKAKIIRDNHHKCKLCGPESNASPEISDKVGTLQTAVILKAAEPHRCLPHASTETFLFNKSGNYSPSNIVFQKHSTLWLLKGPRGLWKFLHYPIMSNQKQSLKSFALHCLQHCIQSVCVCVCACACVCVCA